MSMNDEPLEFLQECRNALKEEQDFSLKNTDNWSHVNRENVHHDWNVLYKEFARMIEHTLPVSPNVQLLVARHYDIASRFYTPTKKAYIGMALFYNENQGMRDFHNGYHPKMVEFLGEAIYFYAKSRM